MPYYHGEVRFAFLASELFLYLFSINFLMYSYNYFINRSTVEKTKNVVIYGAGKAGIKLESEFINSEYKVRYFCDDDKVLQGRSIDNIKILSSLALKKIIDDNIYDLLVIAIPSAKKSDIAKVYENLNKQFKEVQVLPSIEDILQNKDFSTQLKDVSVEDLLARHPKDLDKSAVKNFIKDKIVLVTGAGGSIGSEIVRQCVNFGANQIIIVDHSEYNLYAIEQELLGVSGEGLGVSVIPVMQSVVSKADIQ